MSDRSNAWQSGFAKIPGPAPRTKTPETPETPAADPEAASTPRELHVVRQQDGANAPSAAHPSVQAETVPPAAEGAGAPPTSPVLTAAPVVTAPPTAPAVAPRAAPVPAGRRTTTTRSVSASQVRAERAATAHAQACTDALSARGVVVDVLESDLAGERFHLVLRPVDRPTGDVLENADAISDALGVDDVHCSSDGLLVHVWAAIGPSSGTRSSAVWVPMAVRDAVRAERERTGQTITTVVLTAFNEVAGADGAGLIELFPEHTEPAPGPMTIAPRKVRANVVTPVQLWLYLSGSQEAVLDQAVARTGAGSRSALMTRVLESSFGLVPPGTVTT